MFLSLPYPPTVNHYYGRRPKGGVYIKREGKQYRAIVINIVRRLKVDKIIGPVIIDIKMSPPDKRRRDIDNVLKALLDAMEHAGVYDNDSQIVKLSIEKMDHIPGGSIDISVRERPLS